MVICSISENPNQCASFKQLTQVAEDVLELSQHHGAVLVLVVELAQLDVVVEGSLTVGGLLSLVD